MANALPLRIYPNKDLAARLHQKDPEKYSDENHKPEIAVALTTFELFVSFKPLNEIQTLLQLPFLRQFLSIAQKHFNNETLRGICKAMLTASGSTVRNVTKDLLKLPRRLRRAHPHSSSLTAATERLYRR
jgi:mannose-6-phosphate isomerase